MSKASKANSRDQQIRREPSKELLRGIDAQQRVRVNRFFAQQCVVRRFRLRHADDYERLQLAREGLLTVFDVCGLSDATWANPADLLIEACWLLETRRGREALKSLDCQVVLDELDGTHVGAWLKQAHEGEINFPESFFRAMSQLVALSEDLTRRYNYFDYFSALSLTAFCAGNVAYRHFQGAHCGEKSIYDAYRVLMPEYRWLHTRDEIDDINLALAIRLSSREPRFNSTQIQVFDDRHNDVAIAGRRSNNAVYLRVDLSRAPLDIDRALHFFRDAVLDALANTHRMLANVPDLDGFAKTKFYNTKRTSGELIGGANQIRGSFLGLWSWDLAKLEGKKREDAWLTIFAELRRSRDSWHLARPEEGKEKAILKHLEIINRYVCGGVSEAAAEKAAKLDEAVTGQRGVKLGLRPGQLDSLSKDK